MDEEPQQSGFKITADSKLIADLLDNRLNNSGNLFETKRARKRRTVTSRPTPLFPKNDLLQALTRVATDQPRVADSSPYVAVGSNVCALATRRCESACLSSPLNPIKDSTKNRSCQRLFDLFRQRCLSEPDFLNDFTLRGYLRACSTSGRSATFFLPLLRVLCLLDRTQRNVSFDPEQHVYFDTSVPTTKPRPFAISVTKSLDIIFGEFDADSVARRIVQSQRWKSNALYKELAFDATGRQRSETEVITLMKKKWTDSRDRGTELHTYIHSLAIDAQHDPGSTRVHAPTTGPTTEPEARPDAPLSDAEQDDQPNVYPDVHVPMTIGDVFTAEEKQVKRDETDMDREAAQMWQQLALLSVPRASVSTVHVDRANIAAFEKFNRRRVLDGWLLVASEFVVYDSSASLAGSIDAIYMPYVDQPHLVVLVDWKRCEIDFGTRYSPFVAGMRHSNAYTLHYPKCNYWKYASQLNIYRHLLETMTENRLVVIDMLIVSMPPDVTEHRVFSVPRIADAQLFVDDLRSH